MSADDVARVRDHFTAGRYAARFSLDLPRVRWAWSRLTAELGSQIDGALRRAGADPARARILDLGCGTGRTLRWLVDRGHPRLLGADVVAPRLTEARRLVPEAPRAMADGARLPCRDGAFDLALALTTFSSMPSEAMRQGAAAELLRVVRPGGVVICYEFSHKNVFNPNTVTVGEAALRALFSGADVTCRKVTLHPMVLRALFCLGPRALAALERIDALRSHVVVVVNRR